MANFFMLSVIVLSLLVFLQTLTSTSQLNTLNPYCQEFCGNHNIPYPFGIGKTCSRNFRFEISCIKNEDDGILLPYIGINLNRRAVFNFSLKHSQATMLNKVSYDCYKNSTRTAHQELSLELNRTPFMVSASLNKYISIGCGSVSSFNSSTTERWYAAGCMTFCYDENDVDNYDGSCTGNGCCQTSLRKNIMAFEGHLQDRKDEDNGYSWNPCIYSFVVNQDLFRFDTSYLKGDSFMSKYKAGVPLVLDWVIDDHTKCSEANKNITSYACQDKNSECVDSPYRHGYTCNCMEGYDGNPYLIDGCQDINECDKHDPCKKNQMCKNTEGSYTCSCIEGYYNEKASQNSVCIPIAANGLMLWVKLVLGIGICIIFSLTSSFWVYMMREKRKLSQQKRKFFKQNGGLLLYEEIRRKQESYIFKIFRKEELEKATNNFDNNFILGHGGQGTVYRGTLENKMTVAIKRAMTIDESQKEEFIKEILIVSQINHNNVVKLLGCCLEVEVPMLVYEFVFNGTLHDCIHKENGQQSISLDTRIRIATESAEALAYLHSAASPPILHRDVKSSNILIDEHYVAKVSDFGASILLAKDEEQLATALQGTFGYLDPEYLQTYIFTEKSDVYSFGVVLLELLTRKHAIHFEESENEKNLASRFLALMKQGRMIECLDNQIVDEGQIEVIQEFSELARQCLNIKGRERPTMKEVAKQLQRLRKNMQRECNAHSREKEESLVLETYNYSNADVEGLYSLQNGR